MPVRPDKGPRPEVLMPELSQVIAARLNRVLKNLDRFLMESRHNLYDKPRWNYDPWKTCTDVAAV